MATGAAFQRVEQEFKRLNEQLATGQITRDQYDSALKELMVQDEQGRYWTIGANTGKWYVNDGSRWVEARPPEEAAAMPTPPDVPASPAVPVEPSTPVTPAPMQPLRAAIPPVAPIAPRKSNSRKWIIAIVVLVLVFCLCLCLACAVLGPIGQFLNTPGAFPTIQRP